MRRFTLLTLSALSLGAVVGHASPPEVMPPADTRDRFSVAGDEAPPARSAA